MLGKKVALKLNVGKESGTKLLLLRNEANIDQR